MNNNTVIVDLEKYEQLVREHQTLYSKVKNQEGTIKQKEEAIAMLKNELMKFSYYSWNDSDDPCIAFRNYATLKELGFTKDEMKAFIEKELNQKEVTDE